MKETAQNSIEILKWYAVRRWSVAVYTALVVSLFNIALYEWSGHSPWNLAAAALAWGLTILYIAIDIEGGRPQTAVERVRMERDIREWHDSRSPAGKQKITHLAESLARVAAASTRRSS